MRAGLYSRVSTVEQLEGYSIDAQLDAMRAFCQERGWQIVAEYTDPGHSGTTKDRPALTQALTACEHGELDILLTHRLDRFYRNLQLQLETMGQLGRWGVGFLSTTERIDYSEPQGRLFLSMLGAFNQFYSENLGREIRKGKRGRARAGLSNAPTLPHGYERLDDGREVINETEAAAVRLAYKEYSTGQYTDEAIVHLLTRKGHRYDGRTAGRWRRSTVRYMLQNKHYLGLVYLEGEWLPGKQEPIVSQELFDAAQAARVQRGGSGGWVKSKEVYLLQGLAVCQHCGGRLHCTCQKVKSGEYFYYRDPAKILNLDCPAAGKHIRTKGPDRQIADLVQRLTLPEDWRERLEELGEHKKKKEDVKGKRQYLQAKARRLRELYIEGDFSKADYDRRKADLQAQLDALQDPPAPEVQEAGELLESFGQEWAAAPKHLQRDMLRTLFDAVIVDTLTGEVIAVKPYAPFVPLFRMDGLDEKQQGVFYVRQDETGSKS